MYFCFNGLGYFTFYSFPFMAGAYNDFDCYLHQDNDAKHAFKLCKQLLSDYNIK